jgi:hypothetical protein
LRSTLASTVRTFDASLPTTSDRYMIDTGQ